MERTNPLEMGAGAAAGKLKPAQLGAALRVSAPLD
jgi:hypothetical protein